jgi:hypothetical protein
VRLFEDSDLLSRTPEFLSLGLHEYVASGQNAAPLQPFLLDQDFIFLDAMSDGRSKFAVAPTKTPIPVKASASD